ncbi:MULTISPECIES: TniB family NTP-binding protein [unclassified Shewanella]|uniref:TniB family NTP-binding protein n=1 Tax=Shewanella TaxID=22 RepID=UPI0021DB1DC9|nr:MULTISPECIES: TniB family NTP-binding protein [unclassified Shewanella]MCU8023949.1 TniB family NTP-binding protein [Shewanella sp. SM78]MCU8081018.1 TniB family NTP-binding protein [Shewanella sp. SM103]
MSNKNRITIAQAQYRESNASAHQHNPLILALPNRLDAKIFRAKLTNIVVSADQTQMSDEERIAELPRLRQTRVINVQHLELYNEIYDLVCQGYVDRNPTRTEVIAWGYDVADSNISLEQIERPSISQTTADAIFLTGMSGTGKSTIVSRILSQCLPQVIEHKYDFDDVQVVYLSVDMPHNANRSALISSIIRELDRVLSASKFGQCDYSSSIRNSTGKYINIDRMVDILRTILLRHHVGILVIDEFQNLQVASQRYRDEMLQLFDELSNTLSIPNVKIGTPDTIQIFDKKGRHKRRVGATFELSRINNAKDWTAMMNAIIGYQPINKPLVLSDKISDLLIALTAGVPSILMTLWEACLAEAIRSGSESITEVLIKKTFNKRFPLLKIVTRNINQGKSGRHSDLLTVQQYLDAGNEDFGIKFLNQFVQKSLAPEAAEQVSADVDALIAQHSFDDEQLKKLAKIKTDLDSKRESKCSPQTLEHDE